jgi:site-specific DNA-methyltransferase (adenine-specific)
VLARKPGPLQELAIDACRIGTERGVPASLSTNKTPHTYGDGLVGVEDDLDPNMGRWPANLVLTDPIFDGDTEGVVGGGNVKSGVAVGGAGNAASIYGTGLDRHDAGDAGYGDTGTYSRFFLVPKASRSDREPKVPGDLEASVVNTSHGDTRKPRVNGHPTVKPTDLMRHLVRLVTPQGGTVLDPFLGSGTTALAAEAEGFDWVGIEREAEYVKIAEQRLHSTQKGLGL